MVQHVQSPHIAEFVQSLKPLLPAYRHWFFTCISVTHDGGLHVLRAKLHLMVDPVAPPVGVLETTNLRAGTWPVEPGAMDIQTWLRLALAGQHLPVVGPHLVRLFLDSSRSSLVDSSKITVLSHFP